MHRPKHLTRENASRFQDPSLINHYHLRLPYPPELFEMLTDLLPDKSSVVLDVGTGTGELARRLAPIVKHVDAVDFSAGMIDKAKLEPGGDAENIRWIVSTVEDVELEENHYDLIIGGDSIHWMDWETIFPKFKTLLKENAVVALITRGENSPLWHKELMQLIVKYSVYEDFEPYNLVDELAKRDLFKVIGDGSTAPQPYQQSLDDYINSFHSRGSLSPDAMPDEHLASFNEQLRKLLSNYYQDGQLALETRAFITWGFPLA